MNLGVVGAVAAEAAGRYVHPDQSSSEVASPRGIDSVVEKAFRPLHFSGVRRVPLEQMLLSQADVQSLEDQAYSAMGQSSSYSH